VVAERRGFRSSWGRPEVNPYVTKVQELSPWTVTAEDAPGHRGGWRAAIGKPAEAPLFLEIGPGNGFFFRDLALANPDAALVGVEIRFKRVFLTATKAIEAGVENVRVVHQTVGNLLDLFAPGELDAVWINHPDPWPKHRHHKHRLMRPDFTDNISEALRPGGELWFKSDFQPYGPLAQRVLQAPLWEELAFTADLYGGGDEAKDLLATNIETNYERKKREQGCKILLGRWRRGPASTPPRPLLGSPESPPTDV
jgi:tRNA (guanine-N7-)-methyltransferase